MVEWSKSTLGNIPYQTDYDNERYSPEALLDAFPTLTLALIHKVIAFNQENQSDVDADATTCDAEMERQRSASPRGPSVTELRRRFSARQAAGA